MSSTTTSAAAPSGTGLGGIFGSVGGSKADASAGQTIGTFFSALVASFVVFGIQAALFLILKDTFPRIYEPRTFLVPERERTKAPPRGLLSWLQPIYTTSDDEFLQKCGLDAFFFIRYLRLLLKIFVPLALLLLPLLLPLNAVGGKGSTFATGIYSHNDWTNVTGMDVLSWGNVRPDQTNRYWGHLVSALLVTGWTCFVFYDELRGYIRIRQAYLTSPQHRLRASATTVLVQGIPKKWCTVAALEGLYDVFPGGLRNIWINRNFDELSDKVKQRNNLALALEAAETNLIRNAWKAHLKEREAERKKQGIKSTKADKTAQRKKDDEQAAVQAETGGMSTGDPHQIRHNMEELPEEEGDASVDQSAPHRQPLVPIPVIGQGIDAIGHGFATAGKTVFGGLRTIGREVDSRVNTNNGLDLSEGLKSERWRTDRAGDGTASEFHQYDQSRSASNTPQSRPSASQGNVLADRSRSRDNDGRQLESRTTNTFERGPDPRANDHAKLLHPTSDKLPTKSSPKAKSSKFNVFRSPKTGIFDLPSPTPHTSDADEFPLSSAEATDGNGEKHGFGLPFLGGKKDEKEREEYPSAFDEAYKPDEDGEPRWKRYIKPRDRETMRLPIFGLSWMISLPLLGKKVDTINYCRKEVARLNVEIEYDQSHPENFPVMSSAFVQFNHQVAAHMACQAVSHHVPNQMAPRVVEISPNDVIWDNMSVRWWESYIRTVVILVVVATLIIFWAVPVFFTGLLSQIGYLQTISFLSWLSRLPSVIISIVQGILPPLLLAILLAVLPLILRYLAKLQGVATGAAVELAVQDYYFFFLFVQVFLVVTLSSAFAQLISTLTSNPQNIPTLLATRLPQASNYFFSYLLLQALSQSSGCAVASGWITRLVRTLSLVRHDGTSKVVETSHATLRAMGLLLSLLHQSGSYWYVRWSSPSPLLTATGLIYSVVSPLMLLFVIVTFALFWVVYRYNTLYVTKFTLDTGGLLFPKAINQLFVGLYIMQLCLIGLFLLVTSSNPDGSPASAAVCFPQAIIMVVVLALTIVYQWLINRDFGPLYRYLPITLEDEAVVRDEEFARDQRKQWGIVDNDEDDQRENLHERLTAREDREEAENPEAEAVAYEMHQMNATRERKKSNTLGRFNPRNLAAAVPDSMSRFIPRSSPADRSAGAAVRTTEHDDTISSHATPRRDENALNPLIAARQLRRRLAIDSEAQAHHTSNIGEALFAGIHDELEDLTPEERDELVRRAFQHEALRARRPVIWIPRDDLGVSDDEIRRTQRLSGNIWISNEYTGLDGKGSVVFKKSPPDFSEIDLIQL